MQRTIAKVLNSDQNYFIQSEIMGNKYIIIHQNFFQIHSKGCDTKHRLLYSSSYRYLTWNKFWIWNSFFYFFTFECTKGTGCIRVFAQLSDGLQNDIYYRLIIRYIGLGIYFSMLRPLVSSSKNFDTITNTS